MSPSVRTFSVIICTNGRTGDLLATLRSICDAEIPDGTSGEIVLVDNSVDGDANQPWREQYKGNDHLPLQFLHESRRGKSHGLNTGMSVARGEIFLFTDDDVRVPRDWFSAMLRPILAGEADAVVGGIQLAPTLLRTWMEPLHRGWMASTEVLNPDQPEALIGANMAFDRRVLLAIPMFDPELGPGSSAGSGEESLFSFQLYAAGYRIVSAFQSNVEHHFDSGRLSRSCFLNRARIEGRAAAYIAYHWEHRCISSPWRSWLILRCKLLLLRYIKRPRWTATEGAPEWELGCRTQMHFYWQFLHERNRPRNYDKHGLIKKNAAMLSQIGA